MDAESALQLAEQGMQFIAVGSDPRLMSVQAQETLRILHSEEGGEKAAIDDQSINRGLYCRGPAT